MVTNKLSKEVTLYRNQFEDFMFDIFGDHRLERLSIELDGIMFRIKYMIKNNLDLDKIPALKEEFSEKALNMRRCFAEFMFNLICKVITIPAPFKVDDIIDTLAQDVKIDPSFVKFTLDVISDNTDFLEYIDDSLPDDEPFNMFPDKFFRFYTDSYNDGIAKAFPELFENKEQHTIGTGDDASVFTHSLTFQVGEGCSLNCSYCVGGDTFIHTELGYPAKIKNIKVGDHVKAFKEDLNLKYIDHTKMSMMNEIVNAEVTNVFHRRAEVMTIRSPYIRGYLYITPNHKVLTSEGWKEAGELKPFVDKLGIREGNDIVFASNFFISTEMREIDVYNIETTAGTYIANGLCIHNCYQFAKTNMKMEFSTAKKFIDHLLNDDYGYINRYNSPAIIIEFIGGEPLLEIKLIRKIYEYFLSECYRLNHPWFLLHRLSICSNGMQYFDDAVQSFFKDYSSQISFNISIDGNKELHDSCRIQPNGEGSYDIDIVALNHYNKHYNPERNSKMTLAPSNIKYLFESVKDFIDHNMSIINLNCVFEEGWTAAHAREEYYQLKQLADYIVENDLEHIYLSIFNERQEGPRDKYSDGPNCGGSGSMLSIRPNGQFYACIRYMPTSVGPNVKDLCIGNVDSGLAERSDQNEILQMFDNITRRSSTNDICWECPIASACMNCTALGHTVFGTPEKRTTFTCIMNIAEALANVYYWNLLITKHPEYDIEPRRNVVPDEWSLLVIDKDELDLLKLLEASALLTKLEKR